MIALITFEKQPFFTETEALDMNLTFTEGRVGIRYNELQVMSNSNDVYKEDLSKTTIVDEETEKESIVYLDTEGKAVQDYYLYTKCTDGKDYVIVEKGPHLVNLEEFIIYNPPRFYVEKTIISQEPSVSNIQGLLQTVEDKTNKINTLLDNLSDNTFNQKLDVHVGGGLIVTYNETELMLDACTDDLQNEMNKGWRILAVCVQPNQRRPDYVLGRFNPER